MPIKRAKKGEFGSIISDYNKNLEALNPENSKTNKKYYYH